VVSAVSESVDGVDIDDAERFFSLSARLRAQDEACTVCVTPMEQKSNRASSGEGVCSLLGIILSTSYMITKRFAVILLLVISYRAVALRACMSCC
jgi:hypothetical protein